MTTIPVEIYDQDGNLIAVEDRFVPDDDADTVRALAALRAFRQAFDASETSPTKLQTDRALRAIIYLGTRQLAHRGEE